MREIDPMPPHVAGPLPWIGGGLPMLRDPTRHLETLRARHGDTFALDAFGDRLLCAFSADGLAALYGYAERDASFGLATYDLISRKLPPELFDGRRNTPHSLFGSQRTESYLSALDRALAATIDELGETGSFELFATMRRIGHRLGLGSWAGEELIAGDRFERITPLLDRLDASEAFVRPMSGFAAATTRKRRERAAMAGIESIIADLLAERRASGIVRHDFLEQIDDSFADLARTEREIAVARDIILIHLGSMSNLFAALAWTLLEVIRRPELVEAVRAGDRRLAESCASESIRASQRSITLRRVLRPVDFDDGVTVRRVGAGVLITTMLSVTNSTAAPGLDQWDHTHYDGRRLAPDVELERAEQVSTFGHGEHRCPAMRFSLTAIAKTVEALVGRYDLTPPTSDVHPRRRQVGGVARAERACRVRYGVRRQPG